MKCLWKCHCTRKAPAWGKVRFLIKAAVPPYTLQPSMCLFHLQSWFSPKSTGKVKVLKRQLEFSCLQWFLWCALLTFIFFPHLRDGKVSRKRSGWHGVIHPEGNPWGSDHNLYTVLSDSKWCPHIRRGTSLGVQGLRLPLLMQGVRSHPSLRLRSHMPPGQKNIYIYIYKTEAML